MVLGAGEGMGRVVREEEVVEIARLKKATEMEELVVVEVVEMEDLI